MKMAAIFPIVQMTLEKHRDPDCYEKLHQFLSLRFYLPISNILFCSPWHVYVLLAQLGGRLRTQVEQVEGIQT